MLLDSNIIIYAAEPDYDEVRNFIVLHEPMVSIISKIEVLGYYKLNARNKEKLEILFESLPVLTLTNLIINEAISLRQQRKISLGDSLIASTALIHNLSVATANIKDFNWIDGLHVVNPVNEKTKK